MLHELMSVWKRNGQESSIFQMLHMLLRDPAQNKKKKDAQASLAWAEEVLITKADVKKTRAKITELETKVRELKLANDYEIKVKEKEYARQLSELHDKYQAVRFVSWRFWQCAAIVLCFVSRLLCFVRRWRNMQAKKMSKYITLANGCCFWNTLVFKLPTKTELCHQGSCEVKSVDFFSDFDVQASFTW